MTTPPDPGIARLLRPDGSVMVPASVAGEVLRALVRDLTARARADGGEVSPGARRVLHALHAAAVQGQGAGPAFVPETPALTAASVELTARQVAEILGCSAQYARTLARSGRVRARRAGPAWLIDSASLDAYRTGRSP
ncbi:helix-turn-helix domain-containing protein [Streptomyces sp. NPDC017943]|uniref:helix-turn-helix domain-containing protein n=1 Tax=Streptomyces sp. NPDC017943 TaxID=3365019 RepID=UPI0037B0B38D